VKPWVSTTRGRITGSGLPISNKRWELTCTGAEGGGTRFVSPQSERFDLLGKQSMDCRRTSDEWNQIEHFIKKGSQHPVYWRALNRKVNLIEQNSVPRISFLFSIQKSGPMRGSWNMTLLSRLKQAEIFKFKIKI
jgi:hypothetical protein